MKVLIVVDMQNDFIDGSLGTKEAVGIVDRVAEVMDSFDGAVICTRDTHFADYLETSEGRKLPVEHCIEGTKGHALQDTIQKMAEKKQAVVMNKITFGAKNLPEEIEKPPAVFSPAWTDRSPSWRARRGASSALARSAEKWLRLHRHSAAV